MLKSLEGNFRNLRCPELECEPHHLWNPNLRCLILEASFIDDAAKSWDYIESLRETSFFCEFGGLMNVVGQRQAFSNFPSIIGLRTHKSREIWSHSWAAWAFVSATIAVFPASFKTVIAKYETFNLFDLLNLVNYKPSAMDATQQNEGWRERLNSAQAHCVIPK